MTMNKIDCFHRFGAALVGSTEVNADLRGKLVRSKRIFMNPVDRIRLPGLATALALLAFSSSPAVAQTCDQTLSAGASVSSAISSAAAGATVCLSNGNYGGFTLNNVSKSPRVTVRAVNAGGVNFTGQVGITGSTNGVTFEGINYNGITITGTSAANLTFRNGDASKGTIQIDGVKTTTPNILFENLTHINQDNSGFCRGGAFPCVGAAGYWFSYSGRSTPVATIRGAYIDGGCADGVQSGVPFVLENSTIKNKQVGSCPNDPHTDATQLYGGPFAGTIIRGNYYYRNVQVLAAYDSVDKILVENNVFDPGPDGERRPCQIELYSDDSSVVRHNTIVNRGSYGNICLDRKSADNAGFGTVVVDNIANSIVTANGSTAAQRSNNLVRSGAGAGDFTGAATFLGGAFPTTYAGFELTAGSPGKGAGATPAGSDIGITKSTASAALPLLAPSNLRVGP